MPGETTTTTEGTTNLDTLTAAQLEIMTKEDLQKVRKDITTLFDTAIEERAKAEWAEFKAKAASTFAAFKTYALPVIKYGAGAAILLRVFGVI